MEPYVAEAVAREILAKDPKAAAAFNQKLAVPTVASALVRLDAQNRM